MIMQTQYHDLRLKADHSPRLGRWTVVQREQIVIYWDSFPHIYFPSDPVALGEGGDHGLANHIMHWLHHNYITDFPNRVWRLHGDCQLWVVKPDMSCDFAYHHCSGTDRDFTEILEIGNTLLTGKGDNEGEHKQSNNREV